MSHMMTDQDGFFTVRKPAWTGLGEVLPEYPTREEAKKIAHNWEPAEEPVYRRHAGLDAGGEEIEWFEEIPSSKLVTRDDTGDALAVVASSSVVVGNDTLYDIAEAIQGQDSDVKFETGGSLMGGRHVWLLLKLDEPIMIKGDPNGASQAFFALQNGFDGGTAFRGEATNVRIVCQNTSRAADVEAQALGTYFVFKHTKNIRERIAEAQLAVAGWRNSVAEWQRMSEHLVGVQLTAEARARFVTEFIPMPPRELVSERVQGNVEAARATLRGILAGPTCEGVDLTAYGMVQGATEYLQHYRKAKSAESRFKRAYLDQDRLAGDAARLALSLAN